MSLNLNDEELDLIRTLTKTLNPLLEISEALSGDEYVTASAILPVVYFIQSQHSQLLDAENRGLSASEETPSIGFLQRESSCSYDDQHDKVSISRSL